MKWQLLTISHVTNLLFLHTYTSICKYVLKNALAKESPVTNGVHMMYSGLPNTVSLD